MKRDRGYRVVPFTMGRRIVTASVAVCSEQHTIHGITEVDITEPRRLMREHRERTGETLSLTAYVVACLARVITEYPTLNSVRKGNKLILLDDVTVSILVEREIDGERVPEIFGIRAAQKKSYRQIHDEVRAAQQNEDKRLGGPSGTSWVRFIPGFLLRAIIRIGSRSVAMAKRYGVVSVTAVGMFGPGPLWLVPISGSTVIVSVGSIVERPVLRDGTLEAREHLCLTVSFDHDTVDGAPAARFMKTFAELLENGDPLRAEITNGAVG